MKVGGKWLNLEKLTLEYSQTSKTYDQLLIFNLNVKFSFVFQAFIPWLSILKSFYFAVVLNLNVGYESQICIFMFNQLY